MKGVLFYLERRQDLWKRGHQAWLGQDSAQCLFYLKSDDTGKAEKAVVWPMEFKR